MCVVDISANLFMDRCSGLPLRSFSSCLHRLHATFSDTDQTKLVLQPGQKHNLVRHEKFSLGQGCSWPWCSMVLSCEKEVSHAQSEDTSLMPGEFSGSKQLSGEGSFILFTTCYSGPRGLGLDIHRRA